LTDYYYAGFSGVLELHFDTIKSDLSGEALKFNVEKSLPYLAYLAYFIDDMLINTLFWFLSFAYILPLETVKNRALKDRLEREKLEAEVKFLKAQINPHTLFNGINSIYHLIDKDKDKAKEILVRFSDLLRYQIYDCSDDKISLSHEIQFLENYFDLEKIRKGADVEIEFDYNIHETGNLKIAPLLLIPFVENAFKYVSNHDKKDLNFIKSKIIITGQELHFYIENSVEDTEKNDLKNSGIGLQNVKQRLQLIYPDKHELKISNFNNVFSVLLKIELL
jgi:LytS/YehU family sensor histidine kinase